MRLAAFMVLSLSVLCTQALGQQSKPHRIGFLTPAPPASMEVRVARFKQGLRDLGYIEGQNTIIEVGSADGKQERLPDLAVELISRKPDVIVAHGVLATLAAKKASSTIPVVCFGCGDAVSAGLVTSLARPDGNITGQTVLAPEASGKRVELLRQVVPRLTRLAVLWNSDNPVSKPELKETQAAAHSAGLELILLGVEKPADFAQAFSSMRAQHAQAVVVLSDAMLFGNRKRIGDLASEYRVPAISWSGEYAKAGILMSYGPDIFVLAQRAAIYVDKLLKGAKPSDLPIEQPTKFEFVVNLRIARALGVTIPPSLLALADQVIE